MFTLTSCRCPSLDGTSSSAAADSLQHLSLQEKRVWRVVCDVTAVILMAIAAFLFAFWA